jgi:hypothetical protein
MYLGLKEALHLDRNGLKSLPAENVALIDGLIQMKENHQKIDLFFQTGIGICSAR